MKLTVCPECMAPAEVVDRFHEDSTGGPVEHVKLLCVDRHWFLGPAATLLPDPRQQEPLRPARRLTARDRGEIS